MSDAQSHRVIFLYTLCSEKTPTHIFFHISTSGVDLNKNCSEHT